MLSVKKRYQILKSDKGFFSIFLLFLLLSAFHIAYSFYTDHNQCFIRCSFCLGIAIASFLFSRVGFSVTLLAYAYTLIYFNTFFNYTSFFCLIIAVHCTPKIKAQALLFYAIDVFVVFAYRQIALLAVGIHFLNCVFYYLATDLFLRFETKTTLLLTDDERLVLAELAEGKLQKQIEAFSPNTITKLLKNAMERNRCKTKTELLHRYIKEKPENPAIESQAAGNESQEQSQK